MRWWLAFVVGIASIFFIASTADNGRPYKVLRTTTRVQIPTAERNVVDPITSWKQIGLSTMPKEYYQGVTSDRQGYFFFDGPFSGLYRTDSNLRETTRNVDAIPEAVRQREGYNHIGDISWDAAEGGRLFLPLECFYPRKGKRSNTCGNGAIGVADPHTLQWRYYVKLDPTYIKRVPWNEVSPDGDFLWTSAGRDLLVYRTSEITEAHAAPAGRKLKPVRELRNAVPGGGITGAAFYGERLLVAGMDRDRIFHVWSIDPIDGSRILEIERHIVGESEGLDVSEALGGLLHWQILPYNPKGLTPTYREDRATLLHFILTGVCANLKRGSTRNDRLVGTASGDKMIGFAGDDLLSGGPGDDCLFGDAGNDTLSGGACDDKLVDRAGVDRFVGGPGDDSIFAGDGKAEIVDCGSGTDMVEADSKDTLVGCEKVVRADASPARDVAAQAALP